MADAKTMTRDEYVERITSWMTDADGPEFSEMVRRSFGIDGIYKGKSRKIYQMIRLAYARGVRRGAGCAWEARQPVTLR